MTNSTEDCMTDKDEFSLLSVIADIRHRSGAGDKIMLSELPEFIGRLVQNGQSAMDTNAAMTKKLIKSQYLLKESEEVMARCIALANTRFAPNNSFIKEMVRLRGKIEAVINTKGVTNHE